MREITKDFISEENRSFKHKIGHFLASGLSGFIAGVVCATIIWGYVVWILLMNKE